MDSATLERFYSYVGPVDPVTGCWPWTGALNGYGYGVLNAGKTSLAHKLSYEHAHGPVPPGLVLDHEVCQRYACVHPCHTAPVTNAENVRRARILNAASTSCPLGHPFTRRTLNGWRRCSECRFDGATVPL